MMLQVSVQGHRSAQFIAGQGVTPEFVQGTIVERCAGQERAAAGLGCNSGAGAGRYIGRLALVATKATSHLLMQEIAEPDSILSLQAILIN